MTDRYASFANSGPGRALIKRLGLPDPPPLRRYRPGDPLLPGPVLLGAAPGGRLRDPLAKLLAGAGVEVRDRDDALAGDQAPGAQSNHAALVYDATGIVESQGLRALYDFFHPLVRAVRPSGRVIVFGTPPEACATASEATAQRAVEGFTRSLGREVGGGVTVQLVYVTPEDGSAGAGTLASVESTLRFLLSGKSAYVSGQVIRIGPGRSNPPADWDRSLDGEVALVTGAARGIGAEIARVLAREGAHVVALDVPASGDALSAVANEVRGTAVQLDLTMPDAPTRLADHVATRHGHLDIVVHNAGITRDKTIARMDADRWDAVIAVNLTSIERINAVLLDRGLVPNVGRLIALSSLAGIAGNRGQTNYATSKAGVIGLVQSSAPALAARDITVNAVAPGFIETRLTAQMPVVLREVGRRLNSMAQGGLSVDVAETVAWLASPASGGITGNVVRVCGQSMLGA
jgi:3-oxoacyl-[acyl-carrier protein] reductase